MKTAIAVVGGLGLLAVAGVALAASKDEESKREIWLINGQRYAIAYRVQGPGFDVSMFPGFCNFSALTDLGAEVQFTADWCAANTLWQVPDSVAIGEV